MSVINGTENNDVIDGTSTSETINGLGGNDTISGGGGDDTLNGGFGDDAIHGAFGEDYLDGGDGNDFLEASQGHDTLIGGLGNDTIFVDGDGDLVDGGAGIDTLALAPGYYRSNLGNTSYTNVEVLEVYYNATGTAAQFRGFTRIVSSASSAPWITLSLTSSGSLDLSRKVDASSVVEVWASSLGNNITGGGGNDVLHDGLGIDTLNGGAGDDTLYSVYGQDVLNGGAGNDTFYYTDGDAIDGGDGTDSVIITNNSPSLDLGKLLSVERLVLHNLIISGSVQLFGSFSFIESGQYSSVEISLTNSGTLDLMGRTRAMDSLTFRASSFGNTILTGDSDDRIFGSAVNDTLNGGGGADTIFGFGGTDELNGGAGDDTIYVMSGSEHIDGGAGIDRIQTVDGDLGTATFTRVEVLDIGSATGSVEQFNSFSTIVGSYVSLSLVGAGTLDLTGKRDGAPTLVRASDFGNNIVGDAGDDGLVGGAGNDTLNGGDGSDMLSGGGAGVDILNGGSGDDTIYVFSGTENIDGGDGTDTIALSYLVSNLGSATFSSTEILTVWSLVRGSIEQFMSFDAISDVYNGQVTLYVADVGTLDLTGKLEVGAIIYASKFGNNIMADGGNDIFYGGASNDSLAGGTGNDTYYVNTTGDVVIEAAGNGIDLVSSSVSFTLVDNIENLTLTGSAAINGTGNALNNILTGNSRDNRLEGGAGNDTMSGGVGNDSYIIDSTGDVVTEGVNRGTDWVSSAISFVLGANIETLTLTGTAATDATGNGLANVLAGNNSSNHLSGGAGNDSMDGAVGDDTMTGGDGNDTYVVDSIGDVVIEVVDAEIDQVNSSLSYVLGANVECLVLTGTAALDGVGNDLDNIIDGNAGDNHLDGSAGDDHLFGRRGNDVVDGGTGNDVLMGDYVSGEFISGEADTVHGGLGDDSIFGNGGNDMLLGEDGNDWIFGGGNIFGGAGNDSLISYGSDIATTLSGGMGNDTLSTQYYSDMDKVRMQGDEGDDVLLSGGSDSFLVGGSGNDSLDGGAGNDTLESGSGADTLEGGWDNDSLSGGTENDQLSGGVGLDTLDGGAGDDTMLGGADDDTYIIDRTSDVVIETTNEGVDTVRTSVNYALGENVEDLVMLGVAYLNGTGNGLVNIITGNDGNNVLDGGAGGDSLTGGLGNDTYIVDDVADIVLEGSGQGTDTVKSSITYSLGAQYIEALVLTGTADINGTGNSLANAMTGNSGNNRLDGGSGADTLAGGLGNDTYVVESVGDVVTEGNNHGSDTLLSSVTFALTNAQSIETLTLTGTAHINASGNTLANVLNGNSGNNILNGGSGADTMAGGAGHDIYIVENIGDIVIEGLNAGTDTVQSAITYVLGDNVENLTLAGNAAIDGTGNALANTIYGNAGANFLIGGGGADKLYGRGGNDTYIVDNASMGISELLAGVDAGGIDEVRSSVSYSLKDYFEDLILTGTGNINGVGNGLSNHLTGTSGNNLLTGAGGNDTLLGGLGADQFVFGAGSGIDQILDFSAAQNDRINVHALAHGVVNGAGIVFTQVGLDTVITLGSGNSITVLNTVSADVTNHMVW